MIFSNTTPVGPVGCVGLLFDRNGAGLVSGSPGQGVEDRNAKATLVIYKQSVMTRIDDYGWGVHSAAFQGQITGSCIRGGGERRVGAGQRCLLERKSLRSYVSIFVKPLSQKDKD